jgi:hypothetical protein
MLLAKAALAALLVFALVFVGPLLIGVVAFALCIAIFYIVFKTIEEG